MTGNDAAEQVPVDPEQLDAVLMATQAVAGIAVRSLTEIEDGGLSLQQFRLLVLLCEYGPSNVTALAERVGVHASSATRAVERLRKAGLLRRSVNRQDRREVVVTPTAEGCQVVQRVFGRRRADVAEVLGKLSPADRERVSDGLRILGAAAGELPREAWRLGWAPPPEPPPD